MTIRVIRTLKLKSWISIFYVVKNTYANSSDLDAVSEETKDDGGDGKQGTLFENQDKAV